MRITTQEKGLRTQDKNLGNAPFHSFAVENIAAKSQENEVVSP